MCLNISKCRDSQGLKSLFIQSCRDSLRGFGRIYLEDSSCVRAVMEWRGWDGAGFLSQIISYGCCGRRALWGLLGKDGRQCHCCCPSISPLKRYEDGELWLFTNFLQLHECTFTLWPWEFFSSHPSFCHFLPLIFPLTLTRDLWGWWRALPPLLGVRR